MYFQTNLTIDVTLNTLPIPPLLIPTVVFNLLTLVVDVWLCLPICLVGLVTNALSIGVFFKMGFKDTVNITMTTIAFWDFLRVLAGGLNRMYGPIGLFSPAFGKSWQNIGVTSLNYIHVISGNVSFVLGAYVAVERCLCVTIPLKVKALMTRKRTFIACLSLSAAVFASSSVQFLVYEYKWVFSVEYNTTIAIFENSEIVKRYLGSSLMMAKRSINILYPSLCLAVMAVCTLLISYQLNKRSNHRQEFLTAGLKLRAGPAKLSAKERQVVKMLLVVVSIYITNLAPRVGLYLAMAIEPEFNPRKVYNNFFWTMVYLISVIDFINASVHLFIFYNMSSKFRFILLQVLFVSRSSHLERLYGSCVKY